MKQLLGVFRLFYLLSKYRVLDGLVRSNYNFFLPFIDSFNFSKEWLS